jgi:hypothetical protein
MDGMKRRLFLRAIGQAALLPALQRVVRAQTSPKGWLVLHGGRLVEQTVAARFSELGRLQEAPLVVIPTAHGLTLTKVQLEGLKEGASLMFHTSSIIMLHAQNRKEADSEAFVEPPRQASAVWISGGEDKLLMSTYAGTRTVRELTAV